MSINWVMLSACPSKPFEPLDSEQTICESPARTSLSIKHSRANQNGLNNDSFPIDCKSGKAYLTNRRVVYLPSQPTELFRSFSVDLTNVHDTHVTAPFIGPNKWCGRINPVPNGGLPPSDFPLEVAMTFNEGGAFDFQTAFETILERVLQAMESSGNDFAPDYTTVTIEDLPAYEPQSTQGGINYGEEPNQIMSPVPLSPLETTGQYPAPPIGTGRSESTQQEEEQERPRSPPPGYEEVQTTHRN